MQAGSATLMGAVEPYDSAGLTDFQLSQLSERSGHTVEELAARPWHKLVPSHVHFFDTLRATEQWVSLNEYKTAAGNPLAASAEACRLRSQGFEDALVKDPTNYQ